MPPEDDETRDDQLAGTPDAGDDDDGDDEELVLGGGDEDDEDDEEADPEALAAAAAAIELVVLPIACTNEGKGAPLSMGIQRWWAQELATRGAKAAAPVFTAMAQQGNRQVPALMVFREPWTDARALDGIGRFPNAKRGLITNMRVDDDSVGCELKLVRVEPLSADEIAQATPPTVEGEAPAAAPTHRLVEIESWSWAASSVELPERLLEGLKKLGGHCGVEITEPDWKAAFGTANNQALTSFLVGLGNLSALQGRCVPTTPDQLLSALIDAINRDPNMDAAMQALHIMTDILVANPVDQSAIPLSLQALNVAAARRPKDQTVFHHLAALLRRLGDIGSAVQAFNQAFNLDPAHEGVAVQFIDTLRSAGDKANAFKVAQFAAEHGNESPRVLARLGSLMLEHDQFDEAEPFLRRAIEEGKVPSAYGDLANVLWDRADGDSANEDREEALSLLRAAVALPTLAKSALDILLDLHEEEKNETATMLLLEAAEKHPSDATVLRYVATMYLEGDDPPKARDYLEKLLALPRRTLDDDAFARRGRLTLDVEDFEERYDAAIEHVRSGDGKRQVEAAKFLREVIARDGRFWQPHLMLALAVRESEGDDAALAHLGNAVRLRPNDPEIRNLLVAILRKQGRPRDAVEHLRAIVALNPREIEPVVMLAATLRDANMYGEARQVCRAALQMLPKHPEFTRILESLPPPAAGEEDEDDGDEDGEA
ncbi:MAG: tetratricopeptide repeat protein [Deltaproteobacteria bacterium]|nr:tetratricopeptide repeat protein [Deltaproteobacteria bacterium]MBK8236586.1 tetratricopeptide repeat protein [Deltaproteobacteria bacterium]MBK8717790.1 tetratricopeptide repeat protein [Deltaproteobacteria bacterium]MBP7288839.1 tetratricopeptide repeat protein [Nannocystaceae bacterium]